MSVAAKINNESSEHWNNVFGSRDQEKLGWYETDFTPALKLFEQTELSLNSRIMIAGAGTSQIIDELLKKGFENLVATDISEEAIRQLELRLGNSLDYIVDDLTKPSSLLDEKPVQMWFDRAVLHFFRNEQQLVTYNSLINRLVVSGGFVALAEFAEDGATECTGLEIKRYSVHEMQEFLGDNFILKDNFRYLYTMPSGALRHYNYALFKKA